MRTPGSSGYLQAAQDLKSVLYIHRIMEWFGLEGTLKIICSNPSAMGKDILR